MAGTSLFERLKTDAQPSWAAYTNHEFVRGMSDGSLPEESFRHYLIQDYLFLIQFSRAYALAAYKARTLADLRAAHQAMAAILDTELDLHVRICARWGIEPEQIEQAQESRATIAYTRFVLEAGHSGDLLDLLTALAPCVIGYAEIGAALAARQGDGAANPYSEWIEEYASDAYQQVAQDAKNTLDRLAASALTQARYPQLAALFDTATRLEADFWQMGLTLAD